ncbi:MAG: SRPBCC family protein [Myxococcales bacterium]|nr:SRPBCC family protein [Myxococcales bacterium]
MFHRIHVATPPRTAFAVLSDVSLNPRWQSTTLTARWTSPAPHGRESTFVQTHRVLGWTFDHTFGVLEYEPERLFAYECREGPQPVQVALRVEPTPEGALIEMEVRSNPTGVRKLSAPMARHYIKRILTSDMGRLRALVDGRAASAD